MHMAELKRKGEVMNKQEYMKKLQERLESFGKELQEEIMRFPGFMWKIILQDVWKHWD